MKHTAKTTDNQEELFVVVDRDDRVLGHRSRYDCHHDKRLIHRAIHVLLFNAEGAVLLAQRSCTKDTSPGWWSMSAGGHVSPGESYEQTAHRELTEELGVDTALTFVAKFLFDYGHEVEMEALFTGNHEGPFHPEPKEVEAVRYYRREELSGILKRNGMQLTDIARHELLKIGFLPTGMQKVAGSR